MARVRPSASWSTIAVEVVGRGQAPVSLATPEPGWVEQDANEIWTSVRRAAAEALDSATAKRVVSVGLSTQRESCVIWDRRSGEAADARPVVAGPADGERLRLLARLRPRRRHPAQERPAARPDVLRRQGALAARSPPGGAGARQGGGDLHRHDRLLHPVAFRRRGGDRGRQRLAHAALRRRRRAVGRGAAVDLRRASCRDAARRRLDRAVSRRRRDWRRCPMAFRSAR